MDYQMSSVSEGLEQCLSLRMASLLAAVIFNSLPYMVMMNVKTMSQALPSWSVLSSEGVR